MEIGFEPRQHLLWCVYLDFDGIIDLVWKILGRKGIPSLETKKNRKEKTRRGYIWLELRLMGISDWEGEMNRVWIVKRELGTTDWEFWKLSGERERLRVLSEGVELWKQCFVNSNLAWYGLFAWDTSEGVVNQSCSKVRIMEVKFLAKKVGISRFKWFWPFWILFKI